MGKHHAPDDAIRVTLQLSAALLARVDAVAAASGRSRDAVIGEAVAFRVAEHEERQAGEAAQGGADGEPPEGPAYFSGG